jgi:type IV pilus assembly protein PilV
MTTLVRQKSQSKAFRSHGVSLIEVMVTLVVVSVGVLGFASLQGQTQMAELQAAEYAYASRMVNSMAEHLRADADYGNQCLTASSISYNSATTTPPTAITCAETAHVTTTDSINTWVEALSESAVDGITAGGLPDPAGCIGFTAATGTMPSLYNVEVAWKGTNELAYVTSNCAASNNAMRNSVQVTVVVADFLSPSGPVLDCSNSGYASANSSECSCNDPTYATANPGICAVTCNDMNDCQECFWEVSANGGQWNEMRGEENDKKAEDFYKDNGVEIDLESIPNITSGFPSGMHVEKHVTYLTSNATFEGNLIVEDLCLNNNDLTVNGSLIVEQWDQCHGIKVDNVKIVGSGSITMPIVGTCVNPDSRGHDHGSVAPINRPGD